MLGISQESIKQINGKAVVSKEIFSPSKEIGRIFKNTFLESSIHR